MTATPVRLVEWFRPFAAECRRVMKRRADLVLVIKECAIGGVRYQYIHDLVRDLSVDSFDWLDEFTENVPHDCVANRCRKAADQLPHGQAAPSCDYLKFPDTCRGCSRQADLTLRF